MNGAIFPLPNTPSRRGTQLKSMGITLPLYLRLFSDVLGRTMKTRIHGTENCGFSKYDKNP